MTRALLFISLILIQAIFLHGLFRPGFLAPDLMLIVLLSKAYLAGREALLWAILAGSILDILTDTIGLNLTLYVLSVYIFSILYERFLFKSVLVFVLPSSILLLAKKLLALFMMRAKFSFDVSLPTLALSWLVEIITIMLVYFIYLRKKE